MCSLRSIILGGSDKGNKKQGDSVAQRMREKNTDEDDVSKMQKDSNEIKMAETNKEDPGMPC